MPRDDRPHYVRCTPEEWATAKVTFARLETNPAWQMQSSFRTSAVAAAMGQGVAIDPMLALEFRNLIESRGYRVREQRAPEVRITGDSLAAIGWKNDAAPSAPTPNDHAWLDEVFARQRQGLP